MELTSAFYGYDRQKTTLCRHSGGVRSASALNELLGGGSFAIFLANQQPTKVFSVVTFISTHVITTLPALGIISSQTINGCNLTFLKGAVFSYGVILGLVRARNTFYIGVYKGGPVRARA